MFTIVSPAIYFVMRKFFLLALLTGVCFFAKAQRLSQKLQNATWVKIMSDETTYNFLDAEKEFQVFFAAFQKERKKEITRKERNRSSAEEQHRETVTELLVSEYLQWSTAIRPFVNADGSIKPVAERLAIINKARKG